MSAGRISNTMAIVALVSSALAGDAASPVVLDPFAVLDVYSGPNAPSPIRYMGQPAKEGTVDALTFTTREVQHGSIVQKQMYSPERTWQHATPEQAVTVGTARFPITGLQSGTTYYYRLFVNHDQGKSWDYRSGQFKTR